LRNGGCRAGLKDHSRTRHLAFGHHSHFSVLGIAIGFDKNGLVKGSDKPIKTEIEDAVPVGRASIEPGSPSAGIIPNDELYQHKPRHERRDTGDRPWGKEAGGYWTPAGTSPSKRFARVPRVSRFAAGVISLLLLHLISLTPINLPSFSRR